MTAALGVKLNKTSSIGETLGTTANSKVLYCMSVQQRELRLLGYARHSVASFSFEMCTRRH